MKQLSIFAAIGFFFFISCTKEVADPSIQAMPEINPPVNSSVNASPLSFQTTESLRWFVWNDCTGELIELSGTVRTQIRGMVSDNKITFVLHTNYSGVKGIGQTSGNTYVVASSFNYTNTFNANTQFIYQQSASVKFVEQGSGLSFTVVNDWHMTVNANGEVTRFITTGGPIAECK